ncbi:hypothetical protein [Parabacteroides chinchillae]|uniref:Uncharacterized protein n=1 Tax=Parabacteroides chinchillae TaxID=871327 RepID=A0A8G2F522_9BACT|nr:hypothetical protein [Parabacteroides chinchillae]SEF86858.1 hypothetical protein SAMN05444001_108136 [Parabacteroides chinchillae]
MELKLDKEAICAQCRKNKVHADVCRMKDKSLRGQVEIEFSVCGVCGKGYCSLRADPDKRQCEFCEDSIYNNVNEDGTLECELVWKKKD